MYELIRKKRGSSESSFEESCINGKIEESVFPFIQLSSKLLSDNPLFFLINSYTTGLQPAVLSYMLHTVLDPIHKGTVEANEIGLPVKGNGLVLPCGASGRWTAQ